MFCCRSSDGIDTASLVLFKIAEVDRNLPKGSEEYQQYSLELFCHRRKPTVKFGIVSVILPEEVLLTTIKCGGVSVVLPEEVLLTTIKSGNHWYP